ncbi:MAG: diguanylate cyclase domain-containing protein [Alphaproteobacteria bacterium]
MPTAAVMRILLVEDDRGDARIVVELLKETRLGSFEMVQADRLSSAIDMVEASRIENRPFDAVLLDLSLPDSVGMETVRTFRRAASDLPIIILTGLDDQKIGLWALQEGCQDYLVKGQGDGDSIARTILHSIQRGRLERDLLRAKEQFRQLVEASPDAILVCTPGEVKLINEASRRMCAEARDLQGREFASLFVPRDMPKVGALLGDVLRGARRQGVLEAQLRHPGGPPVYVEVIVLAVTQDGEPAAEVILHDMTARREADRYRYLASSVFEGAADAMVVTDAGTRIRLVNNAFTKITGYPPEEVIGQTPRVLASGIHTREFYTEMWKVLSTADQWRGDIWNRRRNGELYVQHLAISAIRGHDGQVGNYVGVFSDVTHQRQQEDKVRFRAFHDALTGLPNRTLLEDRVEQAIAQARRRDGGMAVLFLDLDGFKPVNDIHGHRVGDELLRQVSGRMRKCIRETDTLSRIGGDEFVILLTNIADCASARRAAQTILDAFQQPFVLSDIVVSVGCSIGISLFPGDGADMEGLLLHADQAMYAAKRAGKGVFRFFDVACEMA